MPRKTEHGDPGWKRVATRCGGLGKILKQTEKKKKEKYRKAEKSRSGCFWKCEPARGLSRTIGSRERRGLAPAAVGAAVSVTVGAEVRLLRRGSLGDPGRRGREPSYPPRCRKVL